MTFATSASFEAPPEIVFDALTDPIGMARWLPHDVARNPVGTGLLRIVLGGTAPAPARVELTYLPRPEQDWLVTTTISPLPAGGSTLDVTVEPQDACPEETVSPLVEFALHRLQREVADRFTTS